MERNLSQNKWIVVLAFASIYIVWGSTYLAIIIGLKGLPPFVLSSLRFLMAGGLLYAWCWWRGESLPNRRSLLTNAWVGTLMLMGGVVSVTWAEQYISSSLAAIIVTTLPFWILLLDKNQWSYYFSSKLILAGLVVGFLGVLLLVTAGRSVNSPGTSAYQQTVGTLVILMGGLAWASGSLYSKYKSTGNSVLMNAAVQFLIAGLLSLVVSAITGEWRGLQFRQVDNESWFALLYLVIMGSLVTYLSYLWLLRVRPPAQVSTYVYINPVVAVILGTFLAKEKLNWAQVCGLIIILSGVLMVNIPKYKQFKALIRQN